MLVKRVCMHRLSMSMPYHTNRAQQSVGYVMSLPVIDSAYLSEAIPYNALSALTADADGMVWALHCGYLLDSQINYVWKS